jgi:cytochrome c oxidase subunit I
MHATIMIFAVIIPLLTGAFGNYLVPLMIGARDMAFPRMNALSYWLYPTSGVVLLLSTFFGMPDAGWTAYPPYSIQSQGPGIDLWVTALHLAGLSSILGAIKFAVTIHKMRAPGMTYNRMPLFVWRFLAPRHWRGLSRRCCRIVILALCLMTLPLAEIRCCTNICSGSIRTWRCTS